MVHFVLGPDDAGKSYDLEVNLTGGLDEYKTPEVYRGALRKVFEIQGRTFTRNFIPYLSRRLRGELSARELLEPIDLKIIDVARQNFEVNKVDRKGRSPLINAASCGDLRETIKLLIQGADEEVKYKGRTAYQWAQKQGFDYLAELIRTPGVDKPDAKGRSPLICAACLADFEEVKRLLSLGADKTLTYKGKTAMEWAQQVSADDIVNVLS